MDRATNETLLGPHLGTPESSPASRGIGSTSEPGDGAGLPSIAIVSCTWYMPRNGMGPLT